MGVILCGGAGGSGGVAGLGTEEGLVFFAAPDSCSFMICSPSLKCEPHAHWDLVSVSPHGLE